MSRPLRIDGPDTFHHVCNRGLARRSIFEDADDIQEFMKRLVIEQRAGRIGIVNYSLLTNHFHLLLHSPIGQLSEALRRIQSMVTRRFNERRERDGAILCGRFWSSLIDSDAYMVAAMRYIDSNAVDAGIVEAPEQYPWSAYRYRVGEAPPTWLDQIELDRFMVEQGPRFLGPRASYRSLFGGEPTASERDWVERRLRSRDGGPGLAELDDLVGSATERFQAWLIQRTQLADGTSPGAPGCSVIALEERVAHHREASGPWEVGPPRRRRCVWQLILVGLMRSVGVLRWTEIEQRMGRGQSMLKRWAAEHRELMRSDPRVAEASARIGQEALRESCGVRVQSEVLADGSGQTSRQNLALEAVRRGGGQRIGGF